jgi:hypothetical protein
MIWVKDKVDDNNSRPPTMVLTENIRDNSTKKNDAALMALKDDRNGERSY